MKSCITSVDVINQSPKIVAAHIQRPGIEIGLQYSMGETISSSKTGDCGCIKQFVSHFVASQINNSTDFFLGNDDFLLQAPGSSSRKTRFDLLQTEVAT